MTCHLNFFKYSFLRAFSFVWYWQWNEIGYRNWERDTFKICLVVFCFNRQVGLVDFSFCFGKEIMSHVLDATKVKRILKYFCIMFAPMFPHFMLERKTLRVSKAFYSESRIMKYFESYLLYSFWILNISKKAEK